MAPIASLSGLRLHSFFNRPTNEDREAVIKITGHLESMVKRILATGIQAQYLLMGSWFTMPATVAALVQHINVIGMVKKSSRVFYRFHGHPMHQMAIYVKLQKRRGRAKVLARDLVQLKDGREAKLVFVRDKSKKGWITVFFKLAKQRLKPAKEIQCRGYDALIAHTSIVFMRYMFIAYQCRLETHYRTFEDLFYFWCDEVGDISFIKALYRILAMAADQMKAVGTVCGKTASAFFDTIMDTALQRAGLSKNNLVLKSKS